MIVLALVSGILFAIPLVLYARRHHAAGERRVYAAGLLIAAAIYVLFAIAGHATLPFVTLEVAGLIVFGGLSWAGARRKNALLLSGGWAAHVLWDAALHLGNSRGGTYTPDWYPWTCLSFDLVIALAILAPRRRPASPLLP